MNYETVTPYAMQHAIMHKTQTNLIITESYVSTKYSVNAYAPFSN